MRCRNLGELHHPAPHIYRYAPLPHISLFMPSVSSRFPRNPDYKVLDLSDLKDKHGDRSIPIAFNDDIEYNVIQHMQGVH